jgi:DNA invertase Pin-like site-specific DNA recombinase
MIKANRVAIYLRVSTLDQTTANSGRSPPEWGAR